MPQQAGTSFKCGSNQGLEILSVLSVMPPRIGAFPLPEPQGDFYGAETDFTAGTSLTAIYRNFYRASPCSRAGTGTWVGPEKLWEGLEVNLAPIS